MLSESEQLLNQWVKDLGRVGGYYHAGPMFMLKPDNYLPLPYTCSYEYDICVDCWVRFGGVLHNHMYTDEHKCPCP